MSSSLLATLFICRIVYGVPKSEEEACPGDGDGVVALGARVARISSTSCEFKGYMPVFLNAERIVVRLKAFRRTSCMQPRNSSLVMLMHPSRTITSRALA